MSSRFVIKIGDCLDLLKQLPDNCIASCVTDAPYEIGMMQRGWDRTGIAYNVDLWRECLRILKPGAHLVAFGGTRTSHRMICAIEDAGFEIVDSIAWIYAQGFPKSKNVALSLDKLAGHSNRGRAIPTASHCRPDGAPLTSNPVPEYEPKTELAKEWNGWGTSLKPAFELICLARKPLDGTVAANVLTFGTGGLNIDRCRVGVSGGTRGAGKGPRVNTYWDGLNGSFGTPVDGLGRWPANVILDEVVAGGLDAMRDGASRFFFVAKASRSEREAGCEALDEVRRTDGRISEHHVPNLRTTTRRNHHPCVKPLKLMRILCRLVTPPNRVVLDPFCGSGSTGCAAVLEGFEFVGIERDPDYAAIAKARIAHCLTLAAEGMTDDDVEVA